MFSRNKNLDRFARRPPPPEAVILVFTSEHFEIFRSCSAKQGSGRRIVRKDDSEAALIHSYICSTASTLLHAATQVKSEHVSPQLPSLLLCRETKQKIVPWIFP